MIYKSFNTDNEFRDYYKQIGIKDQQRDYINPIFNSIIKPLEEENYSKLIKNSEIVINIIRKLKYKKPVHDAGSTYKEGVDEVLKVYQETLKYIKDVVKEKKSPQETGSKKGAETNEKKENLSEDNERNYTSLMKAAENGNIEVAKKLIEAGAEVNSRGPGGNTALMYAVANNNLEIAKLLIKEGARVDITNDKHLDIRGIAYRNNNIEIIDNLRIVELPDLEKRLYEAIFEEDTKRLKQLINQGANINVKGNFGFNPLMYSIYKGKDEIAKILVEASVNVNTKIEKMNVLSLAVVVNNKDMVEYLIEKGADVNAKAGEDMTALIWAASESNFEMVKLLIEEGAKVNQQTKKGHTALHSAVLDDKIKMARILLEAGADPYIEDEKGKSVLELANGPYGSDEMVSLLNEYKE